MPESNPSSNSSGIAKKLRRYWVLALVTALVIWKFGGNFKKAYFPEPDTKPSSTSKIRHIGNFEVLEGCQWVDHKNNDGDSFRVRHGSNEMTIRLYFVDTPEKYISDKYEDQRKRVADQGEYFGGLSPEQTVEVGLQAKAFTEKRLKDQPFTVLTQWENVFDSNRYYAIVWLPGSTDENQIRLSEELVKNGLARIHTKGPWSSNSSEVSQFVDPEMQKLKQQYAYKRYHNLEAQAKQAGAGAWGAK